MEIKDYIQQEIDKIESDDRYNYPPANIMINAPLAIIQIEMKSRHKALTEVFTLLKEEEEMISKMFASVLNKNPL